MEILRRARRLTCLLLAWFALSVGVAIAAPVLQPHAMDSICAGSGMTGAPGTGDGHDAGGRGHMQDCRLCGVSGAPPAAAIALSYEAPAQPTARLLPVPMAARTAAPLAARGPPTV